MARHAASQAACAIAMLMTRPSVAEQNSELKKSILERFIKSGDGWRVGWNPHQSKYKGLVGANDWAIELTPAELKDFCRLLDQLVVTMSKMAAELMVEEKISCEAESDLLWLEVEGYPDSYSLRLIIHGDRRCEGNWSEDIAPELSKAVNSLNLN